MNVDVIGILEISSIAEGFMILDRVVKESPVTILKAEVINPGKYLIMITGDVASVKIAMETGVAASGNSLIDHIFLSNLDTQVIPAIRGCKAPEKWDALGLLETNSVAAAVEAADICVKESDVHIVGIITGAEAGGKAMLKISGAVGDIETAMIPAVEAAGRKGQLCRDIIIPGPHSDIKGFVCGD